MTRPFLPAIPFSANLARKHEKNWSIKAKIYLSDFGRDVWVTVYFTTTLHIRSTFCPRQAFAHFWQQLPPTRRPRSLGRKNIYKTNTERPVENEIHSLYYINLVVPVSFDEIFYWGLRKNSLLGKKSFENG